MWGCGKPLEGNGRAFKVDPVHFWEWEGIQGRSGFIIGNGRRVKLWKDL